jgi:hypothetical protein
MTPQLFVIIDDRAVPPPALQSVIGDVYFGDLLRRRRRYVDELIAVSIAADDTIVLRTADDIEPLLRRIESSRGHTLWMRLPTMIGALDVSGFDDLVGKMRYTLDPVMLSTSFEDDAPMVLHAEDAYAVIAAEDDRKRWNEIQRIEKNAINTAHDISFVDLREAEGLRKFLSGATEPRGFNSLTVQQNIVVKSSNDVVKMRAEHDYFNLASPTLQRFLLPTFDFDETDGRASYKMEHLRVPDAALQFVLGTFSQSDLTQLLNQFFAFVDARDVDLAGTAVVVDHGRNQIVTKMHDRLTMFHATAEGRRLDDLLKAGAVPNGLAGLEERAAELIEKALAAHKSNYLAFSHGDPCLSNILFDRRIGLVRLIDPRGASKREDAMLHPLYDVAKFSHSLCGGYDYVNNGLFSVEIDDALQFEMRPHRGGVPAWVQDEFRARLAQEGWDYAEVRAVEASLFLSMLPLHRDHPRKLLGFALIANNIIQELEALE